MEGLAALWRLAATDERLSDLRPEIEAALSCSAGILTDRQVSAVEGKSYGTPDLAVGAWFSNGETRMDDQQHSLAGLLYAADARAGRAKREPEPLRAAP